MNTMQLPRRRDLALAICVGIGLTACGGGSPSAKKVSTSATPTAEATRAPTDSDQLNQLLRTRANALALGDVDGYVATATGRQAAKDRRAVTRAKALPLGDVTMTAKALEVNGARALYALLKERYDR